jgi:hypothetical protein
MDQDAKVQKLEEWIKHLESFLLENCQHLRERSLALTALEEVQWRATRAIQQK